MLICLEFLPSTSLISNGLSNAMVPSADLLHNCYNKYAQRLYTVLKHWIKISSHFNAIVYAIQVTSGLNWQI